MLILLRRFRPKPFLRISTSLSLNQVNRSQGIGYYNTVYNQALTTPDAFWGKEADERIDWFTKYSKVLDNSNAPFTKWFTGGKLNVCFNAVDRHVSNGLGSKVALIHDSPVTKNTRARNVTFSELLHKVSRLAFALQSSGVKYGDTVVIYMPMIPEAIMTMLACARIGAVHNLVFGGFAAPELASRISHSNAKVIVTVNCGMEPGRVIDYKSIVDAALKLSNQESLPCFVFQRHEFEATPLSGNDKCFTTEVERSSPTDCVPVDANDPLYYLYTSGTTGLPKAVVRPTGGYAVALHWTMKNLYDINQDDVWWSSSDLGWVVGHSYICYAPLLHGNTTIIYEGKPVGTPDPGAIFRVISEHNVASIFLAPTGLRAIRKEDPEGSYAKKYQMKSLRTVFVAGEHCDKETLLWTKSVVNRPVLDHWWQTETGWAITCPSIGLGHSDNPPLGSTGKPVPGWNVKVYEEKEDKEISEPNKLGRILIKLPLPPGSFTTLLSNDEGFRNIYFNAVQGYYDTSDSGYRDEENNIFVMSRTDDVINVAGHRLASGHLEEAITKVASVAEAAVVGLKDSIKGHVLVSFVVLKTVSTSSGSSQAHFSEIKAEIAASVRGTIGAIASLKHTIIVNRLPKTRSGKVARGTLMKLVNGSEYKVPVTIEDASVYSEIEESVRDVGLTPGKRV